MSTFTVAAPAELLDVLDDRTVEILERRSRETAVTRRGALVRRALLAADLVGLALAFAAAQLLVTDGVVPNRLDRAWELALFLVTLPGWVLAAKVYGLYDKDEERADHSTADDFVGVFHLVIVCTVLLYTAFRVTGVADPYFSKLALFAVLAIGALTGGRAVARTLCRRQIAYIQNAIVVGAGDVGQAIARKFLSHPEYGVNVVGFLDSFPRDRDEGLEHLALLGDPSRLPELIDLLDIERVIFAFSTEPHEELLGLIERIRTTNVQIDIVPRLFDGLGPSVSIHALEGIPLLALPPVNLARSSLVVKRLFDVALSALGLVLCAPLFLVLAVLIKLDSSGPVFYRHERIGRGGRSFRIFKFRTMYREVCRGEGYGGDAAEDLFAELMSDPALRAEFETTYKLQSDPRVTRLGRLLRRSSLDELPQLLNVLAGHISLVGPRALTADELETYYGASARHLLAIRPGVTGYWQINGRSNLSYDDRVRLDLAYIGGWSLGLDLMILAKTIRVLIGVRGAV